MFPTRCKFFLKLNFILNVLETISAPLVWVEMSAPLVWVPVRDLADFEVCVRAPVV